MKKILIVGAVFLVVAVGTAYAYFTSQFTVPVGSIQTAVLEVTATETTSFPEEKWLPGDSRESTWLFSNTGTAPVYLKGYITGEWDSQGLSSEVVNTTKIERQENGGWVSVAEDPTSGEEFYHSQTGTADNLLVINPGEAVAYRFTVELDSLAGDEYQLHTFTITTHIAARQVATGAVWPIGY